MKLGRRFEFPPEQEAARQKARRLSWLTIALLVTASFGLAVTLGGSQAMKTAWISDLLSIIPPFRSDPSSWMTGIVMTSRSANRNPSVVIDCSGQSR